MATKQAEAKVQTWSFHWYVLALNQKYGLFKEREAKKVRGKKTGNENAEGISLNPWSKPANESKKTDAKKIRMSS